MKTVIKAVLLGWAVWLAGCNTVSGVGEDLGAAGSAIKEAAVKTKEKMAN